MTEKEWLACQNVKPMLDYFQGRAARARKFRLFACACCRRIWHLMGKKTRGAVEVAELFVDGRATKKELAAYEATLWSMHFYAQAAKKTCATNRRMPRGAYWAAFEAQLAAARAAKPRQEVSLERGSRTEERQQLPFLHDIFGNPFRPVTLDPAWRTPAAVALAQSMYGTLCFDDLLILADALEESGCDNSDILGHCRTPGVHVRGCWVIDLALGKE